MRQASNALARAIEEALERQRLPAGHILGQLSGGQVAPAASGSPGVVDRDDLVALSDAAPQPLGVAAAGSTGAAADAGHVHAHGDQTGGSLHAAATSGAAGFMAAADKSKLDGVAAGATANATDAQLRDRSTHTGTQLASSISDLVEATQDTVAALLTAGANVTLSYNDAAGTLTIEVSGVPSHAHSATDVTSGTLADARLSSNVALKNAANTFSANQQINGELQVAVVNPGGATSSFQFYDDNRARLLVRRLKGASASQSVVVTFAGDTLNWVFGSDWVGNGSNDFFIYHTGANPDLYIDQYGRVYLYNLRIAPASPAAGELYVDASGFLKRG